MSCDSKISTFRDAFASFPRGNRYSISGQIPNSNNGWGNDNTGGFHIHALALNVPPANLTTLRYNYRGRTLKNPGDRLFPFWNVTILDDTGTDTVWEAFHKWSNSINDHDSNLRTTSASSYDSYKQNGWIVKQLGLNGDTIKSVTLDGCFPYIVGPIELDMNQKNTVCQFSMVIAYDSVVDVFTKDGTININ